MELKKIIWISMAIGSFVGSYLPTFWGAGMFSMSSIIFSALGGIAGIWLGFKIGNY